MAFSDGRTVGEQIISGVLITLKFLIGSVVFGVMLYGLHQFLFPQSKSPEHLAGRHPYALGATLLIIVTVILASTVTQWVRALPGLFSYSVYGGLLAIASGHINSRVPIPRPTAVCLTVYMLIMTFLTYTFANRRLAALDRIALIGVVFCLGLSMQGNKPLYVFAAPVVSVCLLLLAWFVAGKRIQMEELIAYRRRHHIPERLYRPHSWTFKN
jgi:hypothetical protein